MIVARISAIVVGALILAAITHIAIMKIGGYGTDDSYVMIALAIGVVAGGIFCGLAWHTGIKLIAIGIGFCIVCGEAYNFLQTADRLAAAADAAQAPKREHAKAYRKAEADLRAAEAAVTAAGKSQRLTDAIKTKEKADAAVIDKSADKGCRDNCRQLLQAAVDGAAEEVAKARAALESGEHKARADRDTLQAKLDGMTPPQSVSPLADDIGIEAWVFGLIRISLGSIAANGLAFFIIAFATHHVPKPTTEAPIPKPYTVSDALSALKIGGKSRSDLAKVRQFYVEECKRRGCTPVAGDIFTDDVMAWCKANGVNLQGINGRVFLLGVVA